MSRGIVRTLFIALVAFPLVLNGCGGSSNNTTTDSGGTTTSFVYPAFIDTDGNGKNDYVESATHTPASALTMGLGAADHPFVDANGDGVCDYAQNGSATWHGPGYVDNDGDGVCDYWQEGNAQYGMANGMTYRDRNRNQVNDAMEQTWHQGNGHDFTDLDGDGVCDYAQNGEAIGWHGDNYIDNDGDGVCDVWATGGSGNGGMMGTNGQPHNGGGHGNGQNS